MKVLLALIWLGLSGCFLSPLAGSVHKAGFTKSSRQETLEREIRNFHAALFWGKYNDALYYVVEDRRGELQEAIRTTGKNRRIVDSKIDYIHFDTDAYSADVDVHCRVHNISTNVVQPQIRKEKWVFALQDGWKLTDYTVEQS